MNFESSFLERGRLYVIGDIHGRSDLLDQMIAAISRDLEANPIEQSLTVTLGDYIDRGPDFARSSRSFDSESISHEVHRPQGKP